jgi:Xaa-Pro aminopeptidase
MLTNKFFTTNRRALQKRVGHSELIAVTAQSLLQRSGDTTFQFRQDSNFFYLTGIEHPDVVLVMSGDEEFLILPKRSEVAIIFGGDINCDDVAKISGISNIYSHKEGWERYKKLQINRKKIYTLKAAPASIAGVDSFYTNPARRQFIQKLKRITNGVELCDIRADLVALRQIKTIEEVACIQSAIDITAQGFSEVKKMLRSGVREYEVMAVFDYVFKRNNTQHGYAPPIVVSGANACVVHYVNGVATLKSDDLLLMDVGAECQNYTADVSRTYSVSGAATDRQQEVLSSLEAVTSSMISYLKPGITWKEYSDKSEEVVGEELIKLGLITNVTREAVRRYFPHAIGHSLGLDVHDVCDYKTIQEGMVITVEPGIYIPEEELGARIEEDVLITKGGVKNLSATIPYV